VALVNNNGSIAAVIGTANYNALDPNHVRTSTIGVTILDTIKAGQYNLRIVTKMTGGDWKIIEHSLPDVPKSIPFTVTAETGTGVKGGGYGLWLRNLESEKATAAINENFQVSSTLKNASSSDFPNATLGVALMDEDNNIVAILKTTERAPKANASTSWTITCKIPSTVAPGQYKLRIVVKTEDNDEWRVATIADGDVQTFIDFTVQ